MRILALALSLVVGASAAALARGGAGGGRRFSGGRSSVRGGRGITRSSRGTRGSGGFGSRPFAPQGKAYFGTAAKRTGTAFTARKAAVRRETGTTSGGTGGSGGSAQQTPPPYYYTPGALIRTAGQLPKYEAANNAGTASVEGGGFVAQDPSRSQDVGRAPGLTWGTPMAAGGSGGSGASANPGF